MQIEVKYFMYVIWKWGLGFGVGRTKLFFYVSQSILAMLFDLEFQNIDVCSYIVVQN